MRAQKVAKMGKSNKEKANKKSVDAIAESHLKSFFMHSNNVFYIHDTNQQIQFISPQIEELLGYNPIEAMVKWTELISGNPLNKVAFERTQQAIKTGQRQKLYDVELIHKDGSTRWVEVNESPIVEKGATKAIIGSLTDITESKQNFFRSENLKQTLASTIDSLNEYIAIINGDGVITHVNQAWKSNESENLLVQSKYGIGTNYLDIVQSAKEGKIDNTDQIYEGIKKVLNKESQSFSIEYECHDKDEQRWFLFKVSSFNDINNGIRGVIVHENISKTRISELALKRQYQKFISVYQNIPEIIYVTDPATNEVVFVNKFTEELLGFDPVGKQCYKAFQNLDQPCDFCTNDIILNNGGKIHEWEHFNEMLNKQYLVRDQIINWPDGRKLRFELAIDINSRKATEIALRESEQRFKSLIDNLPESIIIHQKGKIVFVNNSTLSVLGLGSVDQIIGKEISDFMKPGKLKHAHNDFLKSLDGVEGIYPREDKYIRPDNTEFDVSVFASKIEFNGEEAVQLIVKNITSQKQNENKLKQINKEREENLWYFESIDKISSVINKNILNDDFIVNVLKQISIIFNADRVWLIEQATDDSNKILIECLVEEDSLKSGLSELKELSLDAITLNNITAASNSEYPSETIYEGSSDDSILAAEYNTLSTLSVKIPTNLSQSKLLEFHQCVNNRKWSQNEKRLLKDIADRLAQAIDNVELYKNLKEKEKQVRGYSDNLEKKVDDRTGELEEQATKLNESQLALTFLLEDVNESRDELKTLINDLETVNTELESFSYSVSHDLRAPLTRLEGFSNALIKKLGNNLDQEASHYLERIIASSQNMGDLIKDMLTLSRITRKDLTITEVDISGLSKRIIGELKETMPQKNVNEIIEENLVLRGDQSLFEIMFTNILNNALKYSFDKEIVEVTIGNTIIDGKKVLFIKDNGIGFNMKYYEQLFTPFRRLHTFQEIEGSGVGLATVKRIINRHKGKIWAESEENIGTTFYIII